MASSTTTLLLYTNQTLSSSFINSSLVAKPSQLFLQGRRNQSFKVSCNANNSGEHDKNLEGVDRRNVLLGLGGLYGAANLAPLATAAPIPAPDLKSCSRATITNGPEVPYSCCPSIPEDLDKVPYYKFPSMTKLRIRPPAHAVDEEYIAKYNLATSRMRELDKDPKDPRGFKQQANVHCAYCSSAYKIDGKELQVHESWLFFPFHRWAGTIENIPHTPVHIWTGTVLGSKLENGDTSFGENMGNFYSAGLDPVFYCHHGNVDRMWNEWKQIGGKRRDLTDKDWLNSEFFSTMKTATHGVPTSSRTQKEKNEQEEILTFNCVKYDDREYIRFDVFLNADKTVNANELDKVEFSGSYTSLPHVHANHNSSPEGISFELAITELLEDIGLEDEDTIAVTVVPKAGGETISIEGAEIKLVAC
ncbi:hypothetical protein K7X08_012801 [Anisodus acutangulus]|uniref:catechol oxidase n=1 Tax=Anisodus acutangulus TaxID=402998 RepID=A0A9Q1RGA3_9SOLA|nr:hypothetical protein K7X08_012801 [Anisodus acutangulus]